MVVEDDPQISSIICENIEKHGFGCRQIDQFENVLNEFIEYKPDLVLMDINLPCYDGFYWCGKVRVISKVPLIFLSARNTDMDIIIATNMGGDDYLIKPFSIDVLMAKVSGLLRRVYSYNDSEMDVISYKGLIFNFGNGSIQYGEKSATLSRNEIQIISTLLKNRGVIVSRERIIRTLWKDSSFIDDNTLTVNITRLRKKLDEIGLQNYIETRKGEGYLI
jgi:Response regulators consisting of a CheY-like receiver domain and a winged-helix DNA-binding domain